MQNYRTLDLTITYSNVERAATGMGRLSFFSHSQETVVFFIFLHCLQEKPKCSKGSPASTQNGRLFTPQEKWLSFVCMLLLQKSPVPLSCTNLKLARQMTLRTAPLF
jgi:hypothetical protein